MEERPAETHSSVDSSAPPSVAQLAGRFREQAAAAKETPANKPTRRKPPCSLPLFPPKVELGQNGEEKSLPNASHPPKFKVKSSPLIEKLQANLTFDPAALLPGASPKSPGLKAMVSPFHSPPSTPSSPGVKSQPGEAEEVPVSFDQPPEGTHLPCYNKVRTRGSIKRRPPSRRFRRSQSDCGDLGDFRAAEPSQENGAREENGNEVFTTRSKASEGSMGEGASGNVGPEGKPPLRRTSSRMENQEKAGAPEETMQNEETGQNSEDTSKCPTQKESLEPPHTSIPQAENGYGSPVADKPAGEELGTGKSTEEQVEKVGNDGDRKREKIQDAKKLEEAAKGEKTLQNPSGGMGDSNVSDQEEKGKENQDELAGLEAGCSTRAEYGPQETSNELQSTQVVPTDDTPVEDTKM
ncbi:capZ-interacting protein isoform X2 [Perognathus longimembris pacificus]|uniref:capZ-interacting protein isoform X2 n=1 Tax=Perognathus longimembris pacificus TaxID=214514 RepID=UPI002019A035|nr:capZ-interacting protein isoform X2 [Perognathus longimembris pacificus]